MSHFLLRTQDNARQCFSIFSIIILLFGQPISHLFISDKNDWYVWAEVFDFRGPFFRDVFQRVWRVDAEAH